MNALMTSLVLLCAATTFAAALVVAQKRLVASLARRFTGLSRFEQALLVVAICVMTVCAQKSGTNEVSGAAGDVFNAESGVPNAEETELQRRREEDLTAQRGSGIHSASQEEGSALVQRGSGLLTASTEEDDVLSRSDETSLPLLSSTSAAPSLLKLLVKTSLADDDCARGFVRTQVGTNEVFDFSPPDGACLATNWLKRGAVTDFRSIRFDGAFPFDGVDHSRLLASASGEILLFPSRIKLKPFAALLGIVPEANWGEVFNAEDNVLAQRGSGVSPLQQEEGNVLSRSDETSLPLSSGSLFCHKQLDDGTLLLTWQNVLLNREAANPVSVQAVLSPSGDVTYRYDLSHLASDDLLTNVVVAAGTNVCASVTNRAVTSWTLRSVNSLRCNDGAADFAARRGDADLWSCPPGSTNTVYEHLFYAGTTNAPFAYPTSTSGTAILRVAISGSGNGALLVGERFVPLAANDSTTESQGGSGILSASQEEGDVLVQRGSGVSPLQQEEVNVLSRSGETPLPLSETSSASTTLLVPVARGRTQKLFLRGDATLSISLDSDDFAFGELPSLAAHRLSGWINFPFLVTTPVCFHGWNKPTKLVTLARDFSTRRFKRLGDAEI